MGRIALGVGALVVAGLVVVLVVKTRAGASDESAPGVGSTEGPSAGTQAPAPRPLPGAAPADASPLPTPEEVAEAKAQVEAEHVRSPSHAPEILDNNLKAQPMRAARVAMRKGDYDSALDRAEAALAVEPDSNAARVMAVMAACNLGNRAVAQAHADKLDDMRKARVAQRCEKFGIELRGVKPVGDDG
jgi:hypothetical protein